MYKIGLDIGYGNTKIVTEKGNRICFPSLAKPGEKIDLDKMLSAAGDYVVTINGQTWFVGEMAAKEHRFAIRAFDDTQRFNNPAFQAMLATSIAAVTSGDEQNILLVTGLPLSSYAKSEKQFRDFLSNFTAMVEIGGVEKNIAVKQAHVFPQAAGIFLNPHCEKFKKEIKPGDLTTVVDIGYRTTDVATFKYTRNEDFEFVLEYSFTLDIGMVSVFRDLANRIAEEIGAFDVSFESAERTFMTGSCRVDGKEKDYGDVNRLVAQKTVESIADAYRQRGPGKDTYSHVIMAGGGSIALKSELSKAFPEAIFMDDAQFANAIGFLDVAKKLDIVLFD